MPGATPSDDEIRKILAQRVDDDRQSVGIVAGVVEPAGRRIVAYGALDKGDLRPLNGDTVFEIGSITKVFTALLLSDMVRRGEVRLADPVAAYLPPAVRVPQRNGQRITLQDLATHTSGLPRLPSNLKPDDPSNPYADYTVEQLYHFLSTFELPRNIDAQFEYSNLGFGLLGHALARRAGRDYESLVRTRITGPLGMHSTAIVLSAPLKSRLAVGHNARLDSVGSWDLPTLAGAGALRSTANDMLTFLAAHLDSSPSALGPAMAAMLAVRRSTGNPGLETALGWHVFTRNGPDIVWKDGGTGGYGTFIGYDPEARVGVVVLANAFRGPLSGVDDIGLHVLDRRFPVN